MVIFPFIAFLVSAACALVIGRDAIRRPRPDRVVWTVAFGVFAIAAAAEVAGSLGEWSAHLARVYYLCGAVLVVGYLALGEGYLLARERIEKAAPGLALLVTALAATMVIDAPIDQSRLSDDGWDALERGPALVALAVSINTAGTIVLVGGALYSAWRFRTLGSHGQRMIGCILIAVGTLVVASGGTLTRFGHHEYLYIAMALGVAIIFAGVLQNRRPEAANAAAFDDSKLGVAPKPAAYANPAPNGKPRLISLPGSRQHVAQDIHDQALFYIESKLLPLSDDDLSNECAVWSVARTHIEVFSRAQARMAWDLRTKLTPAAQDRFDALPVAVRLQVVELYVNVLSAEAIAVSG